MVYTNWVWQQEQTSFSPESDRDGQRSACGMGNNTILYYYFQRLLECIKVALLVSVLRTAV
jgi:hypothetical protein